MSNESARPALGKLVPKFVLPSTSGDLFDVEAYRGKKLVLFFYPRDNTPGCTLEGQQFNELEPKFAKKGAKIFGISRDSIATHKKYGCKFGFNYELLSDSEEKACRLFGVIKEKNMYGKKVFGIERSTFVLNEKGELQAEFRGVKAEGHAAEVLAAL